jgi:UDP-glucuronate 4-epimerase
MKNILITGAAGFIGYHLCEALIKQGQHVVGLDNIND